jgi:hypothetical protein
MAIVRVDFAALAAVAGQMQLVPHRLATVAQEIRNVRTTAAHIGDPAAASDSDELLRQLSRIVDLAEQATVGMTRALQAASGDYARVEEAVVRFDA